MPRQRRIRSDEEILAAERDVALLEAIAAGRVTRDGPAGFWEPAKIDGEEISVLTLRRLARDDLIDLPMGARPRLAPRGCVILEQRHEKTPSTQPEG